jgi:hypothetical protein
LDQERFLGDEGACRPRKHEVLEAHSRCAGRPAGRCGGRWGRRRSPAERRPDSLKTSATR